MECDRSAPEKGGVLVRDLNQGGGGDEKRSLFHRTIPFLGKELRFSHKLYFSNAYIFATKSLK